MLKHIFKWELFTTTLQFWPLTRFVLFFLLLPFCCEVLPQQIERFPAPWWQKRSSSSPVPCTEVAIIYTLTLHGIFFLCTLLWDISETASRLLCYTWSVSICVQWLNSNNKIRIQADGSTEISSVYSDEPRKMNILMIGWYVSLSI